MKNYVVSFNHYELGIIEVIVKAESIEEATQIMQDKGIKDCIFVDTNFKKEMNKSMVRRAEIKYIHLDVDNFKIYISTNGGDIPLEYSSRDLVIDSYNSIQAQITNEKEFITIENYL